MQHRLGQDKVVNADVLQRVNEARRILDTIWHWKHSLFRLVLSIVGCTNNFAMW